MRIALFHDAPPGGARRALNEFGRRLAEWHTLDLYQFDHGDGDPAIQERADRVISLAAPRPRPHQRLAAYWNDWQLYQDLQDLARVEAEMAARIDAGGHDVAFLSVQRSCQAPGLLRHLRTPSLYFMQEPPLRRFFEPWCRPTAAPLTPFERGRYLWRWPARTLLDRVIYRRDVASARQATRLLANSRYTAGRVQAVYGRPAAVNYYGVDSQRFHPGARVAPTTPSVVSIGALEAHKGYDFVIRALGRIPATRRPSLTIVAISGHPRLPGMLERLAARLGVNLTIRRGVGQENRGSDDALVTLYQSHHLFVFGAHYEPIPLVISEAMACGLPVVAVAEGGVPELVQDGVTGLLTERDEAAYAAAIDRLLCDPARCRQMGQAARAAAVAATWEASARRLEDVLAETATQRSVRARERRA